MTSQERTLQTEFWCTCFQSLTRGTVSCSPPSHPLVSHLELSNGLVPQKRLHPAMARIFGWQKKNFFSVQVTKVLLLLFSHLVRSNCFATPQTIAHQAPQSMDFSRHEYWSGLPFASAGQLPDPGIKPASPALAGGFFTTEPPGKPKRPS